MKIIFEQNKILKIRALIAQILVFFICVSEEIKIRQDLGTKTLRTLEDL